MMYVKRTFYDDKCRPSISKNALSRTKSIGTVSSPCRGRPGDIVPALLLQWIDLHVPTKSYRAVPVNFCSIRNAWPLLLFVFPVHVCRYCAVLLMIT